VLNPAIHHDKIPHDFYEEVSKMKGALCCQKCGRKRFTRSCPSCGYDAVYIRINYEGKRWTFFKDEHGKAFSYKTGKKTWETINQDIEKKCFRPQSYIPQGLQEKQFSNAFERFIEKRVQEGKMAPSTEGSYRSYLRKHFQPYFNDMPVTDIKLKHLDGFINSRNGLSSKYKKNLLTALQAMFSWLVRWGELEKMPILPDIGPVDSRPGVSVTRETQKEILEKMPPEHRDLIEFIFESGLRPSEAIALKLSDYDRGNKAILIRRTYSRSVLRETTKQKKTRWKALYGRALILIDAHSSGRIGDDFIFINPVTKKGYRYEFVRKLWRKYCGVSYRLYDCGRHTYCTQIVDTGINELQAQEITGHADRRSLSRYYHGTIERQREALEQREKVLQIESYR